MGEGQTKEGRWERIERKEEGMEEQVVLMIMYAHTDLAVSLSYGTKCNQNKSLSLGLSFAF